MLIQQYTFRPLDYQRYLSHFEEMLSSQKSYSQESAELLFLDWLDLFYKRSGLFYHAQYIKNRNSVDREFRAYYNLPEEEEFDDFYLQEWEQYCKQVRFEKYKEDYQLLKKEVLSSRKEVKEKKNKFDTKRHSERFFSSNYPRMREINALWFNTVICNDDKAVSKLKKLPYSEYLKTEHWGKVRAAQMLIHKAVCQEQCHYEIGESWYTNDWESDIHVHHLTYENRGNERYDDLVLLCAKHHEEWHREFEKLGKSHIILVDDE